MIKTFGFAMVFAFAFAAPSGSVRAEPLPLSQAVTAPVCEVETLQSDDAEPLQSQACVARCAAQALRCQTRCHSDLDCINDCTPDYIECLGNCS